MPCGLAGFAATWQPDPLKLMCELAERVGQRHFPNFREQVGRSLASLPSKGDVASLRKQLEIHRRNLVDLEMQRAQYGIDVPVRVSRAIEHEEAEIARLREAEKQLAEDQEQQLRALSLAFCDELSALTAERPAVLLLDGYEHTPSEAANWIQDWLLQKSIREQETRLIAVLAGQPAGVRPCFEPWGNWWRVVVQRQRLSALRYEHVREYYCDKCGLTLEEAHLRAYHIVVQDDPYMMAQIAANLGGCR